MRYAALVSCCDIADFGPHRMLTEKGRRILYRFPDELLFALAQYIYSIEPPKNPNLGDPRATAGKKVFDREGCGGCRWSQAMIAMRALIGLAVILGLCVSRESRS